ncbi:MAG: hypothetical protein ACE5IT_02065 [bacterium]
MTKRTLILVSLLLGVLLLLGPGEIYGAQARLMTKGGFVHLLIRVMGLQRELPPGAEKFSPDEFYRVEVEILAKRGLTQFLGTNRKEKLRRGELANILYNAIVKVPEPLTMIQKIAFLAERGLIKKGKPTEAMTEKEVLSALRIPDLVMAIVETYTPPPVPEVTVRELPEIEELYEDPASPIMP